MERNFETVQRFVTELAVPGVTYAVPADVRGYWLTINTFYLFNHFFVVHTINDLVRLGHNTQWAQWSNSSESNILLPVTEYMFR
jgi:uncharacterized lipoprotein YddW (UPF0748 family)